MRIVIDMQGAQSTGSKNRGIGRYTRSLVKGILRNSGGHEVILALNGIFSEGIEDIRTDFKNLLPQDNIRVWHPIGPSCHIEKQNGWYRRSSELLREAFLSSLDPNVVLVASLFEGLVDDAVSSVGRLDKKIMTAVILYDLIPLIHRRPYLDDTAVRRWYEDKLDSLRRADLLLGISESSCRESIEHLGANSEHVVNISTAADPQFCPKTIGKEKAAQLRSCYGLSRPYVMYTGGIDHRKNIEGLIRAYAKLSVELRKVHQLVIVCSAQSEDKKRLKAVATEHGLAPGDVILTGYVPEDDLITFYNLCKVFIFPSWHEGFGLPALEAMACGKAVIASNCSSLPEVIGRDDALFDPFDDRSITDKLRQVLTDCSFRQDLERYSVVQASRFTWDQTAKSALAALERYDTNKEIELPVSLFLQSRDVRPRLAFVSPLPPDRSGIADYSAELLPELSKFFDIDVIIENPDIKSVWINENCGKHDVNWFRANAHLYDRVLYHFGNSEYHSHMFGLLNEIAGVVVLHDFFLSGIVAHLDCNGIQPNMWIESLYDSHGYKAIYERWMTTDTASVIWQYPCNHTVLEKAQGVIVHSDHSCRLSEHWYGGGSEDWQVIPLMRNPVDVSNEQKASARSILGLHSDQYIVCSFGLLGRTKLNQRLLDSWLNSRFATDERCVLIFVGENEAGEYGASLKRAITESGCSARVKITGWADTIQYERHLHAADVGVQLRSMSRGETSAAVLDCMNYGLATIVNANGSMADLPGDAVWRMTDDFSDEELVSALTLLYQDEELRTTLGMRAKDIIRTVHAPDACAGRYAAAIEHFYKKPRSAVPSLITEISKLDIVTPTKANLVQAAQAIDLSFIPLLLQPQILVDVSELIVNAAPTDIQHVIRFIIQEWLHNPPAGYRVEPVYTDSKESGYRYARQFTLNFMGVKDDILLDEVMSYHMGDRFIGFDFQSGPANSYGDFHKKMSNFGVNVQFFKYEILAVYLREPEGAKSLCQKLLDFDCEHEV